MTFINLTDRQAKIIDALWQIESSRRVGPVVGDNGNALGPLQIWEAYWLDATRFDPGLGGEYVDVADLFYAVAVTQRYMERYAGEAWRVGNAEVIARTHNGGPTGPQRVSTLGYWDKVRDELEDKWPGDDWG